MDLRKKFVNILRKWGHDILLQRSLDNPAVGPFALEEVRFADRLERHTVRQRLPGSLGGSVEEEMEGLVADYDMVFYFKWDVNPKRSDRIYDKNPAETNMYTIELAHPLRYQNGRIEYWIVGANNA